jgi:hypothetical protein
MRKILRRIAPSKGSFIVHRKTSMGLGGGYQVRKLNVNEGKGAGTAGAACSPVVLARAV